MIIPSKNALSMLNLIKVKNNAKPIYQVQFLEGTKKGVPIYLRH